MYVKPVRPPDVVADAIARAITGATWSGSIAALFAAIEASALDVERRSTTWPRSAVALAACVRSQTDALHAHGLRLSVVLDELLIERVVPFAKIEPSPAGRAATWRRLAA